MKKVTVILLILLFVLFIAGCDTAKIEVGVENGVVSFNRGTLTPTILLKGETDTKVEDELFFGKLVSAIEGKTTVNSNCGCQPLYRVGIGEYTFALHTHGITIFSPMGKNVKGKNVLAVDCTYEELSELFVILACVPSTTEVPDYPGLPDVSEDPTKGVEIYCFQKDGEWKCGGTEGTNRIKTDLEIRALQTVTIPEMRRIIEQKGLTDCFIVLVVDLSGDVVEYSFDEDLRSLFSLQLGRVEQ